MPGQSLASNRVVKECADRLGEGQAHNELWHGSRAIVLASRENSADRRATIHTACVSVTKGDEPQALRAGLAPDPIQPIRSRSEARHGKRGSNSDTIWRAESGRPK